MKATITHNLTDTELVKTLATLADQSEIGEELLKAVKSKTCACDDTPKIPRHPLIRQLYQLFVGQEAQARADIEFYAERILQQNHVKPESFKQVVDAKTILTQTKWRRK